MRSFQQIVVLLFALLVCAFAQTTESYDATVYLTSTITRVNTVTLPGSSSSAVANQTSTISAVVPTSYHVSNATSSSIHPTGSKPTTSQVPFTGAAASLNANAFVVALVAGVGYLVL